MPNRYTIKDMQAYAANNGGKCLSKEFINSESPLKWRCEKGHTWEADFQVIRQGGWCRQCAKEEWKIERFEELQEIAASKGGSCLSSKYIGIRTKMKWQCKEGHTWSTTPFSIKYTHSWCAKCATIRNAEKKKDSIDKYIKFAKQKGGKLISTTYVNSQTKLIWQCSKKHTWEAKPNNVYINNSWCPYCAGTVMHTIEQMHAAADKRGGQCLSTKYINSKLKLKWRCAKGHTWMAAPHGILIGQWCAKCNFQRASEDLRTDIKVLKKLAVSKGGKLLSTEYINSTIPLQWQCSKGHTWWARASGVKNNGQWCAACVGLKKHTIEMMHALAAKKNGKCLSTEYFNSNTKLEWQCQKGHKWKTTPHEIITGSWCPYCAGTVKLNIKEMQRNAKKFGGKCLSTKYINVGIKLKWQCRRGHVWMTTPNHVRRGHWCGRCGQIDRNIKAKAQKAIK